MKIINHVQEKMVNEIKYCMDYLNDELKDYEKYKENFNAFMNIPYLRELVIENSQLKEENEQLKRIILERNKLIRETIFRMDTPPLRDDKLEKYEKEENTIMLYKQ